MAKKKVKYVVDMKRRKRFPPPLFTTTVKYELNIEEVEKFKERNGRLPDHIKAVEVSDD